MSDCVQKWPLVETKQHLAGLHHLIIGDIDFGDAAGDVGTDQNARGLDIGIVGRDVTPAR